MAIENPSQVENNPEPLPSPTQVKRLGTDLRTKMAVVIWGFFIALLILSAVLFALWARK